MNLKMLNIKTLAAIGVIGVLAVLVFLMWRYSSQPPAAEIVSTGPAEAPEFTFSAGEGSGLPAGERRTPPPLIEGRERTVYRPPQPEAGEAPGMVFPEIEPIEPVFPIPQPDLEAFFNLGVASPSLQAFLERVQQAAEEAEGQIFDRRAGAPTFSSPGTLSGTKLSEEGIALSLTEEEFDYVYPPDEIKSLQQAQALLKSFDPSYRTIPKIETAAQVQLIQENMVRALRAAGMITQDEAERYLTTIRFTMPQLNLIELEARKHEIPTEENPGGGLFFEKFLASAANLPKFLSAFVKPQAAVFSAGQEKSFVEELTEKIKAAIVSSAYAGGGGPCGFCFVSPLCFQPGPSPAPFSTGQKWTPFCYCTGCLFGQGCLDFCVGRAAIWDPMTGACGCG